MNRPSRRSFLGVLIGSISAVVGSLMAIPLFRFATSGGDKSSGAAAWAALGTAADFQGRDPVRAEVEVHKIDGWQATRAKQTVWVTHDSAQQLRVLSAVCPHLGCIVPWVAEKQCFVCPCHGGEFARDGARLSGPPPRGLDALPSKLEDGKLMVRYQYFRQLSDKSEVIG